MQKTLLIVIGPHAVGKMTVGQELARITELKLFHNHMSIELVRKLFEHSDKEWHELNKTICNSYQRNNTPQHEYNL